MRRRRRHAPLVPQPLLRVRLTKADWAQVVRARASMAAFDTMPEDWRRFCADYPRTARGSLLAQVLDASGWDVGSAKHMLMHLLPVATL